MPNVSTVPLLFCTRNGSLVDLHTPIAFANQRIFIGVLYLAVYLPNVAAQTLCFAAICHRKHLQYSCYKLMMFVSFLDILNLSTALLLTATFSLIPVIHCEYGNTVLIGGKTLYFIWYAYCAAATILAFNRFLEFAYTPLVGILFSGRRAWIWIFPIFGYAAAVMFTTPYPYFYVPDAGVFSYQTPQEPPLDVNHVVNNLGKFAAVSAFYLAMWILMKIKTKGLGSYQVSAGEKKLSIQALLVGVFAGCSTVGYLAMEYLPLQNVPFMGVAGTLLWASVHSASAWIYLTMNKSIRRTGLTMIRLAKSSKTSVTTVAKVASISQGLRHR